MRVSGNPAPPGTPRVPCRSRGARPGRRAPSADANPRGSRCRTDAPRRSGRAPAPTHRGSRSCSATGAGIDDEAVRRLPELLAPIDVLTLAVRLPAIHVAAELLAPPPDLLL